MPAFPLNRSTISSASAEGDPVRVALVGDADSLMQLNHALPLAAPNLRVIGCIIPDEARNTSLDFAPVIGSFRDLPELVREHRIGMALVTLPMDRRADIDRVAKLFASSGVDWQFMLTLQDQLAGRALPLLGERVIAPAAVATTDKPAAAPSIDTMALINRKPHDLDRDAITRTLRGRVVLITGAGGSIGSELARLAAGFAPARLVLMERSENALFEIDRQIARLFPKVERAAVLHDVTNAPRTMAVITAQKPAVIFHAAAHKHVPMMEEHPSEAVENNFYGTRSIADAAARNAVDRFVMISSDKAVNPSSVMGATKRMAELYIQHLNSRSDTTFRMVRFGNVLGSACSVLPIWSQQLAQGHALTVTHPDMQRYFMTIPEAAGLVLQSAALEHDHAAGDSDDRSAEETAGGEVLLLDMGQPVRILDLARRFLVQHGRDANAPGAIEFTGIRPGEKLFEELAYGHEGMIPTSHRGIRIWQTTPPTPARMSQILTTFDRLRNAPTIGDNTTWHPWEHASHQAILTAIRAAVPEMVVQAAASALAAAG